MKEKLIINFDKFYKEFKDYLIYFQNYEKEQTETIPQRIKPFLEKDLSPEEAFNFTFEIKTKPIMMSVDLNILKERLLTAYEMVENLELEIPQEVKTEIEELKQKKDTLIFAVKNNEIAILDQEKYDKTIERTKRPEYFEEFQRELKNVKL